MFSGGQGEQCGKLLRRDRGYTNFQERRKAEVRRIILLRRRQRRQRPPLSRPTPRRSTPIATTALPFHAVLGPNGEAEASMIA